MSFWTNGPCSSVLDTMRSIRQYVADAADLAFWYTTLIGVVFVSHRLCSIESNWRYPFDGCVAPGVVHLESVLIGYQGDPVLRKHCAIGLRIWYGCCLSAMLPNS